MAAMLIGPHHQNNNNNMLFVSQRAIVEVTKYAEFCLPVLDIRHGENPLALPLNKFSNLKMFKH
jgi:hypothetical protein